jgi:hypothetical protein
MCCTVRGRVKPQACFGSIIAHKYISLRSQGASSQAASLRRMSLRLLHAPALDLALELGCESGLLSGGDIGRCVFPTNNGRVIAGPIEATK